jgi:hypothetical protein
MKMEKEERGILRHRAHSFTYGFWHDSVDAADCQGGRSPSGATIPCHISYRTGAKHFRDFRHENLPVTAKPSSSFFLSKNLTSFLLRMHKYTKSTFAKSPKTRVSGGILLARKNNLTGF